MRSLILAFQFLTRLPTPSLDALQPDELARSAPWFPLVGLLLGGLVAAALAIGAQIDPWLGALLGVLVWVGVTGALHLDGLADLADALGASHGNKDRLFSVLADPHIGVFGVVALVLQLVAKLVLLMLVARLELFWVVVFIPAWARLGALVWARLPSLKPGLGERFSKHCSTAYIALWGAVLLSGGLAYPPLWAAPLLILAWHAYLQKRLGGMNGDALGAGVEWLESGLLLVMVLGKH